MKIPNYGFCPEPWDIDLGGRGFDNETANDGGDAHDFLDRPLPLGWHLHTLWGADGWDTPEYPYVLFLTYNDPSNGIWACAQRIEGDMVVETYTDKAERDMAINAKVWWYWRHVERRRPSEFDPTWPDEEVPERFRHPFTYSRLELR